MGDEADADWQDGLVEWGIEDTKRDHERRVWNEAQFSEQYLCNACNRQLAFGRINAKGCPHCGRYRGFRPAPVPRS